MTRVVRHPPGKERPRDAPMATLVFRRAGHRVGHGFVGRWHSLTIRLEARRGATRPRKWRRWVSYANVTRVIWLVAVLALLAWVGEGLFILVTHDTTGFEQWRQGNQGFDTVFKFVGPILAASIAAALFLFWWYRWTKRRYLTKALRDPRRLVPTAGYDTAEIVGREDIAQVIAERLRERDTRRPYLLVGGVGTGKTAVLVRLTELLARQHAVPVPVRLRDAADGTDLNFERLARQRFAQEAPKGILARSKTDRVGSNSSPTTSRSSSPTAWRRPFSTTAGSRTGTTSSAGPSSAPARRSCPWSSPPGRTARWRPPPPRSWSWNRSVRRRHCASSRRTYPRPTSAGWTGSWRRRR
ncbi:hypothetical protein OG933_15655 [Streptomyces sp. NBC_00016]|uniref:hypothetical protein n=1 Tax=Streptomyces sp. NBC_00016 TaxID=2975622 RepID=UPI0032562709